MTLNTSGPEPIEITFDEAKALLARAVEEKGADYVYEQVITPEGDSKCAYFDPVTKAPSCLVGHVLAYKGVTYEDMHVNDVNTYASVRTLAETDFIRTDEATTALLGIAQCEQDEGMPWGRALEEALETYEVVVEGVVFDDDPSRTYL